MFNRVFFEKLYPKYRDDEGYPGKIHDIEKELVDDYVFNKMKESEVALKHGISLGKLQHYMQMVARKLTLKERRDSGLFPSQN